MKGGIHLGLFTNINSFDFSYTFSILIFVHLKVSFVLHAYNMHILFSNDNHVDKI